MRPRGTSNMILKAVFRAAASPEGASLTLDLEYYAEPQSGITHEVFQQSVCPPRYRCASRR
jgi:hypothetical protein